jgi:hypothetical protein
VTLTQALLRLARMSPDEVRHRLAVAARRQVRSVPWIAAAVDRDDPWLRRVAQDPAARAAFADTLSRRLGERLYGRDWSPVRLAESLRAAGVARRIVTEAEQIRARRLTVLGYGPRDLGRPIDWHRDPVTGARWPRRRWGAVRRDEVARLDVKMVWELSRHQHFQVLAAATALTGETAYADELADQLASWIEQNPTGIGIHWREACEPAFRLLAWLWALPLALHAPRFTPELCLRVLRALVAQARYIAGNLSIYSSPNTHLLAEALALFVVGVALPELREAAAWRQRGRAILEREIETQVGEDGFYREASTYYHAYAVEFYVLATVIAERNDIALAPLVRARLERMLEALAWLVRPDGTLPNVGDADGGRTLRLGAANLVRVDELLAVGAVLTGRAELRAGLPATGEEAAWLWPDGRERVHRLGEAAPPRGSRMFPDAGLAVDRGRVDGEERWALLDATDLGMMSGGHGHAGCLGIGLFAHGRALVVDRGTGVYNAAPAWRRYFRNTRAHSSVVIDGVPQAEADPDLNFRWGTRYRSRLVRHVVTADHTLVTGEHDGYRRLASPVTHRRTLLSVGRRYWICVDVFTGNGTHSADFLWQLPPGLEVERAAADLFGAPADAAAGLLMVRAGFDSASTRVVMGSMDPIQGWHSDNYGDRRPAPTVVTTDMLHLPAIRVHLLAPCARARETWPVVESEQRDDGLAISIRLGGTTDLVLCSTGGAGVVSAHGAVFSGELLHARLTDSGDLGRTLGVQTRHLAWKGEDIVRTNEPPDWIVLNDERVLEGA